MNEPQIDLTGKLIIKVKLGDDIRRILITNEDITYDELVLMMQRVYRGKLNSTDDILIKYKDEDNDLITIFDSSDLTFAIQCSRILNITLFVNGKPEPLQTNEVKHIKKELRQIRDMCNQLLDKLDQREPQPGDNIVDSSTASIPKIPSQIPDTRKRPSPTSDMQITSTPSSKEFDPLSKKVQDQSKVVSSFGLSNDIGGGTIERAGTPDSVSSIGSSASNKGRMQPQQPQQPQKPTESPSHQPFPQPGSQPTVPPQQSGTPAHAGIQSMYGGQIAPSGQKMSSWPQPHPSPQPGHPGPQPLPQPGQQPGGQYPPQQQQTPASSAIGQPAASGFPPAGSQQQGFPSSSQGQPTQAGYGQQPPTSQFGGYGPGPQAGPQGPSQMYQPQGQYNPQMGNQPVQPVQPSQQQQPQQQQSPQQPQQQQQQYGYGQPQHQTPTSVPQHGTLGSHVPIVTQQGPPGSNPYARQAAGGFGAGYPRPAGNYPQGYQ